MKTLTLEIVTPEKLALSEAGVESVVLPAALGELGVLPGHAPYLVQIAPGAIRIRRGGETRTFAVGGGFADIGHDKVSVFAETAELAEEIDAERARQALEKAKAEQLKPGLDPMTLAAAEASARRAAVRLKIAEMRGLKQRGG